MAVPVAQAYQAPAPAAHRNAHSPSWAVGFPGGVPPVPLAEVLQSGTTGVAYSETVTSPSGVSPFTFSLLSGALPTGLSLSSGGVISGTPSVAGTYTFTIRATDANGSTGDTPFEIIIAAPASGASNYSYAA